MNQDNGGQPRATNDTGSSPLCGCELLGRGDRDPVSLHDVAHVPVRAHRPVVPVVLYAGLQRDHIPAVLRARNPGLVRGYLLEIGNLVSVRGSVGVAQVDDVAKLQSGQVVELVVARGTGPAQTVRRDVGVGPFLPRVTGIGELDGPVVHRRKVQVFSISDVLVVKTERGNGEPELVGRGIGQGSLLLIIRLLRPLVLLL